METYLTSFLKFVFFFKKIILTVILHGGVRTGTVLLPKATGYQTKTQVPGVGYPPFQVVSQGESTWVIPPEYDDRTLL